MLSVLMTLFLSTISLAQTPAIVPLNDGQTHVTHIAIPFRISGAPVLERTAQMQSEQGSCRVMLDPFRKETFLVKCSKPDRFTLDLWVRNASGDFRIQYGPVNVTLITDQTVVTPEPEDPRLAQGLQLFNALCASCHSKNGNLRPIQGRTAAQITTAISTVSSMTNIVLTNAEKDAIAFYLGN